MPGTTVASAAVTSVTTAIRPRDRNGNSTKSAPLAGVLRPHDEDPARRIGGVPVRVTGFPQVTPNAVAGSDLHDPMCRICEVCQEVSGPVRRLHLLAAVHRARSRELRGRVRPADHAVRRAEPPV